MRNSIINSLNDTFKPLGYFVLKRRASGKKSEWYDLYDDSSERGFEYFGSLKIIKTVNQKKVFKTSVPKSKSMESANEVIQIIRDYNSTRLLPADFYSPARNQEYNIESAFAWYLEKLGFKRSNKFLMSDNTFVLTNLYGEYVCNLTLCIDDAETCKGSVVRSLPSFKWIESSFESLEQMIGSVNSLLEPEMLISCVNNFNVAKSLTKDRSDNISANEISLTGLQQKNIKNALKEALSNAIASLDA